jgi:hypothetical protein
MLLIRNQPPAFPDAFIVLFLKIERICVSANNYAILAIFLETVRKTRQSLLPGKIALNM